MRLVIVASVIAACIAGAAIAQETTAPAIQWDERPSPSDFANAYPSRARDASVAGYSLLCCSVRANRRLDCEVAVAWPSDYGFDRAGEDVAEQFRMSRESFAAWPGGDARIRRGIVWRRGAATPELQAALAQIHDATKATCTPPGVEAAPGADDIITTMVQATIRQ
jgi:hypothetical protein